MSKCELSLKVLQIASIFQITHFTYILGELSISEFSDPYLITHLLKMSNCLITHLLKMSNCELSLKVLQIANFSQITHSCTFGRAVTW